MHLGHFTEADFAILIKALNRDEGIDPESQLQIMKAYYKDDWKFVTDCGINHEDFFNQMMIRYSDNPVPFAICIYFNPNAWEWL